MSSKEGAILKKQKTRQTGVVIEDIVERKEF